MYIIHACLIYAVNQDVYALTQKLRSIMPITPLKLKLETSSLNF